MALIKLLIIDDDNEYSINLCNFLTHSYSETFAVYYCRDHNDINNNIKKIAPNVILSSEKYYSEIKKHTNIDLILLSSLKNPETTSETDYIYKYKDVNQIAVEIINIHTTTGNKIYSTGGKNTKVISVFSAAGTVGKTSLALAVSSICSFTGLSVFYLNLEQFQSTGIFFNGNTQYSFSDIIYFAKEKDKNLVTKIPAICSRENDSGVYYFSQTNNVFDIKEMLPEDIDFIVSAIKDCGYYDLVMIDMDSQLNENTMKVFEKSDEILYVITKEESCLHKTKLFINSIDILSKSFQNKALLKNKIKYIANKVSQQALLSDKFCLEQELMSQIVYDSDFPSLNNLSKFNGGSEMILNSFRDIAGRYTKHKMEGTV
ncbi:ATPase [Clostridium sp. BNL1100]|uniref:ATPase n=1 Tax=Clostridium sp. BNL1100 TaxID=755731 RepID=UPI00024A7B7A|nr:ATPase [Clostridium sp. BNL1100]AEY65732.1 ATPase involved in chromosome partitioning [Clostridium sp. BNL1100]